MIEINAHQMAAEAVLELLRLFDEHHIEVIVDGGWGVDALLGKQTRSHEDLDIAMPHKFVPVLRQILADQGYHEVPRPDSWECNFVLGDDEGHLVDVHTYTFDERGRLRFGLPYTRDSLTGHGSILGQPVRCITAEWLVRFHSGYTLDDKDYHDVYALCSRFGITLPFQFNRRTK